MKFTITMCFSFLGFAVMAQELPDDFMFSGDSVVQLTELTITANKIPELRTKVAQQIKVITAPEIQSLNMQTAADLIANSGVAAMQKSQQGGGSPQLRGFEASRIVLVVDGVRMNNLIYRAGHLQNIVTLDNSIMERAEILLGPSSTVYGSDALGGVIHFRTRPVKLSDDESTVVKANAFLRYGTVNEEMTGHADVNVGWKRFGSFTSLTHSDFGDLRMGEKVNPSYGKAFGLRQQYVVRAPDNSGDVLVQNDDPYVQKFSGYSQYDLLQKFLFKPTDRIAHEINFQFSNSSNVPRYDRLTDPDGAGLRSAQWYYGPQKRLMAAYTFSLEQPGSFADALRTTLSYQSIKESRHDRRFNRPNLRNQVENVDVVGLTIDFNKKIKSSELRYGYDGQFNQVKSTAYNLAIATGERSGVGTRYPDGENKMNFQALYGTHTWNINQQLTLNDGLRAGYASLHSVFVDKTFFPFPFDEVKQNNLFASGNVGLIYRPANWKFSVIGSTGYRVPNVDDVGKVFDTSAGTALVVPNPDVKPEKTVNVDVGVARHIGDRLWFESTGFFTSFFDAIVTDAFTFNGQSEVMYDDQMTPVMANQNTGRAFIRGVSALLRFDNQNPFSADASYNYTYGRIKNGSSTTPLDHIPPSFGRVSFRYRTERFGSDLFVNFNGWKRIEDYYPNGEDNEAYATEEGMPSWYTINLRGSYRFNKYFTLQTGIDNILDLQYRTFASGINAPGRNFFATVRFSI